MAVLALKKGVSKHELHECNKVMLSGFLLRVLVLVFILAIATSFTEPYFVKDDIKYEETAAYYLRSASSLFDLPILQKVSDAYIAPFWPWVLCLISYLFRTVYAGRFLNVILSTLMIRLLYRITHTLSSNHKSALLAAKFFAFLPLTVFMCCFSVKDVFISFGVLYIFYLLLLIEKADKVGVPKLIFGTLLLIALYYSRGAVTELLILFAACFILKRLIQEKKYIFAALMVLAFTFAFIMWGDFILKSFEAKIDSYGGTAEEGTVAWLTVNSITDIYKIPISYFFASLQPVKINFFTASSLSLWLNITSHFNVTIYPIAVANFLYAFERKHSLIYWLLSTAMYFAVINLSLGVFRHYMFLVPFLFINAALWFTEKKLKGGSILVILGTTALFFFFLLYSVLQVLH